MRTVYVEQGSEDYYQLFRSIGFTIVDRQDQANLVCFTGGEDVSPVLYDHPRHATTWSNKGRDLREKLLFNWCIEEKIPMVGICRGGQFLNVCSGGTMYQDVSRHAIHGTHEIVDCFTGESVQVTSTHHQMMKPGKAAVIVALADECGFREDWNGKEFYKADGEEDYEVLFYPHTQSLCFQPHPEFRGYPEMKHYFALLLTRYLGM